MKGLKIDQRGQNTCIKAKQKYVQHDIIYSLSGKAGCVIFKNLGRNKSLWIGENVENFMEEVEIDLGI